MGDGRAEFQVSFDYIELALLDTVAHGFIPCTRQAESGRSLGVPGQNSTVKETCLKKQKPQKLLVAVRVGHPRGLQVWSHTAWFEG